MKLVYSCWLFLSLFKGCFYSWKCVPNVGSLQCKGVSGLVNFKVVITS